MDSQVTAMTALVPPQIRNQGSSAKVLIWGGNGWIAGLLLDLFKNLDIDVEKTTIRMENREAALEELDRVRPTHVLNCAGVTGRPNVDWCESNREATIRSNAIGTLNLADCCWTKDIHCTVFATGCKSSSSTSRTILTMSRHLRV